MKIVIFGASGKTGQILVEKALFQGHEVTAFVRNPAKISLKNKSLQIIQGDILDQEKVNAAVKGQDAVVLVIGAPAKATTPIVSEGTKNVLSAMQQYRIKRLICESGLGAGESFSQAYIKKKLLLLTFIRNKYKDKTRQEQLIKESTLDWTIVRPTDLTDGPFTGSYKTADKFSGLKFRWVASISRADVADFLLKELSDPMYIRKAATITS